jgi:uncharacterized protein (DUF608 family)
MAYGNYKGANTNEISFPLGGIGSGCIGLAGNGRLVDWEIFNKPNKGSFHGLSHFAVKAESAGKVVDARVLHSDLQPPYNGAGPGTYAGFGFGVARNTMAGCPHFVDSEFTGSYPFARINFIDEVFPGECAIDAFNPLIPLNDLDSSIPAAFFDISVKNTTAEALEYTICGVLKNPQVKGTRTQVSGCDGQTILTLDSRCSEADSLEYGDMSISTDAEDVSYQRYWFRGTWFDSLGIYWRDLCTAGKFNDRDYADDFGPVDAVYDDHCTLAVHLHAGPGETVKARFTITWNFPNRTASWRPEEAKCECGCVEPSKVWQNYYSTLFDDSRASAAYCFDNWDKLHSETALFHDALFSSTVPDYVLDAVSANISILKSPTVMRLTDGSFYGFEGCHCQEGCCEGSCSHVWNYAYALPFLFPSLERSMRDLEYGFSMREDGKVDFRLQLPVGRDPSDWRPCADGQFGGIIKVYREWKISGDDEWLRTIWPLVKKSLEFAWSPTNEEKWDLDKDGVLEGRQHHTLDMELFGPNAFLTGFYLAALKAGAEIATHFGETESAQEYTDLFERGSKWVNENLFNGEYFQQKIDINDKSILEQFPESDEQWSNAVNSYWDSEHNEIKYQVSDGCHVDQVIGQWHANLCGLGQIFDPDKVHSALEAIYKNNYRPSLRDYFNPCRIFGLNDEAATVICYWPDGKYKPAVPIPYAEECMNGFEYQAGIHMIQEGLVDEGLTIIKAVRDRYNGENRNPWNEIECGSNYARSMASYAALNALSGFEYDLSAGHIGFNPVRFVDGNFKCFWSLGTGWGTFECSPTGMKLTVLQGKLVLNSLSVPDTTAALLRMNGNKTCFRETVTIEAGKDLVFGTC